MHSHTDLIEGPFCAAAPSCEHKSCMEMFWNTLCVTPKNPLWESGEIIPVKPLWQPTP
jgi:hypothetical protein